MTCTLVLGGARSGKSAYAEKLAESSGHEVVYIATAEARDEEMSDRIALHRDKRSASWTTVEEPIALGTAIAQWQAPERLILFDCLTVWLSNLLFSEHKEYPEIGKIMPPPAFDQQRKQLLDVLAGIRKNSQGNIILVSNEVGLGVIPQGAISRWFVDEAGRPNQAVASVCDQVFFVAAGLPMKLKGT